MATKQKVETAETVTVNRDATKDDARALRRVYNMLFHAVKESKKADRAVTEGWTNPDALEGLREVRDAAIAKLDTVMDESWAILTGLPKGTTYGTSTTQTIGLQFFNRNLNRDLKSRITAADAKRINRVSFGL